MSQLLTPPTSRQTSEAPDTKLKELHIDDFLELSQSLDSILEHYLHLLDKHQRIQTELASRLSLGYLFLAHANYSSSAGRWYGADYYDERMKATRRVVLQPSSSQAIKEYKIVSFESATSSDGEADIDLYDQLEPPSESDRISVTQELVNKSEDPQDSSIPFEPQPPANTNVQRKTPRKKKRTLDPIRWYGILVPPSLRNAQKSFTEAVEGSLPELASIVVEMRAAEKEISRLREELGRR
ncbi:hypothetical protein BJX70DRAFT_233288 [Aspergillus crustosus]